jgi:vancomycin permeability regulator SanA
MGRAKLIKLAVALTALATVALATPALAFRLTTDSSVSSVKNAPKRDVALVLGAGLEPANRPSTVLQARIDVAVTLYKQGTVRKLLMSGDNSIANYDEVSAMKNSAVAQGIPANDVLLDYAGFRTLDSCVRLRKVFGQTSALVVTQGFHLPRTIHLCRWAGVEVIGVEAPDPRGRSNRLSSSVREIPASFQAWAEAHIFGRSAKFLGPNIDVNNPPPEALKQPLDTAA